MQKISVILACAGLGSRLYSEGLFFAKPLFYYQTKPIIVHLLDQYCKISNDVIVVISDDDKGKFLEAYLLDYYQDPKWLSFTTQKEQNGTNSLVDKCLNLIKNEKVLISWSDFLIQEDIGQYLTDNNIFFTADIKCRFSLQKGVITHKTQNSGFCGIYYLVNKPILDPRCEDFIENYLGQEVETKHIKLTNLGTINELIKNNVFISNSNRFFNQIEFQEDVVIKTAIDKQGIELQKKEINWYKNIPAQIEKYIPKFQYVPEKNQLILERIKGIPISQIDQKNLGSDFWCKKLPKLLEDLHHPMSIPVDQVSVIETYIEKPKKRLKQTERMIRAWFDGDYRINGIDYGDFVPPKEPKKLMPEEFVFGHGDLTFSNLLMNEEKELKMIDPRSYFGHSQLYMDSHYDIAKIFYSISGYEKVNEGDFLLGKTSNGTILAMNTIQWDKNIEWFWGWCQEKYGINTEKLNFLLQSIWLSLTGYILNKPTSVIAAYCRGMIIGAKYD